MPLEANCRELCRLMDHCFEATPEEDWLQFGGTAISLLDEVLLLKMKQNQQIAAFEETSEPEAENEGFPMLDDDDDRCTGFSQ